MKSVAEFLTSPHPTAFSFEVLPPLRGKGIEQVYKAIDRLVEFSQHISTLRPIVQKLSIERSRKAFSNASTSAPVLAQ